MRCLCSLRCAADRSRPRRPWPEVDRVPHQCSNHWNVGYLFLRGECANLMDDGLLSWRVFVLFSCSILYNNSYPDSKNKDIPINLLNHTYTLNSTVSSFSTSPLFVGILFWRPWLFWLRWLIHPVPSEISTGRRILSWSGSYHLVDHYEHPVLMGNWIGQGKWFLLTLLIELSWWCRSYSAIRPTLWNFSLSVQRRQLSISNYKIRIYCFKYAGN